MLISWISNIYWDPTAHDGSLNQTCDMSCFQNYKMSRLISKFYLLISLWLHENFLTCSCAMTVNYVLCLAWYYILSWLLNGFDANCTFLLSSSKISSWVTIIFPFSWWWVQKNSFVAEIGCHCYQSMLVTVKVVNQHLKNELTINPHTRIPPWSVKK